MLIIACVVVLALTGTFLFFRHLDKQDMGDHLDGKARYDENGD